jgi:hypothetical protein
MPPQHDILMLAVKVLLSFLSLEPQILIDDSMSLTLIRSINSCLARFPTLKNELRSNFSKVYLVM